MDGVCNRHVCVFVSFAQNLSPLPRINGRARLHLPKRCYSSDPLLATIVGDPQDFFRNTSGRWVWGGEQQLREKYREFNIAELQKVAMDASSVGPCFRMEKICEIIQQVL